MALYIPAGQRRRRLIIVGAVALVVGLVLGAVIGRTTAPTLSDEVSSVRSDAQSIYARLQSLPLEYEQALSGGEGFTTGGGPADALATISGDAAALAARAQWLSAEQRAAVVAGIDDAQQVASTKGSEASFQAAIDAASATVSETFGLPTSSGSTDPSGSSGSSTSTTGS